MEEKGEVIEAAGGLVWREEPDGKKIAIIHRTRHGGGWTLPKGKLEKKDETWKKAAEREVSEETGCKKLRIESFAGSISYIAEGIPKIVLFWNMVAEGECKFEKTEEVDQIQWLPVRKALELLRYPKERALLKDASFLENHKSKEMNKEGKYGGIELLHGRKPAIFCRLKKIFKSTSHERLDATVGPFELELRNLIDKRTRENKKTPPCAERCLQMVECAKQALHLCEIELGWGYFHQAELLSLYLLDDKNLLRDRAQTTLDEAEEKLSYWRKKTVQSLLGKDGDLKEEFDANDVYTALKILQEHHTNTYIKLSTALFQLKILGPTAVVLIVLSPWILTNLSGLVEISNAFLLLSVILFGAMGGTVSGIITIARRSIMGKIPDQLLSSWLTISKPIFGAMSALAISVFLLSGLIQSGDLTYSSILALSFAAGFSERLLLSAVEK